MDSVLCGSTAPCLSTKSGELRSDDLFYTLSVLHGFYGFYTAGLSRNTVWFLEFGSIPFGLPNANQFDRPKPMLRILTLRLKDKLGRFLSLIVAVLLLVACEEEPAPNKVVHRQRRDQNLPRFRLLSEIEPANFKAADLRFKPQPVWVKSGSKKGNLSQSTKPAVDAEKTELLAQSIASDGSDKDGVVKPQREGVVIYPGTTMPTRVDFDVTGKFDRVILHAWLVRLPEEALSDRRFGTAGVSVLVDGRSYGWAPVNRHTNQSIALDLSHASELSVVVDNYNNLNLWDWCMVGLE